MLSTRPNSPEPHEQLRRQADRALEDHLRAGGETAFQRWELPHLMTAQQSSASRSRPTTRASRAARPTGWRRRAQAGGDAVQRLQQILDTLGTPLKELDERVEQELVTLALSMRRA
ncbi:MAG: flagellar assembly protein FliH [Chromatiales bacterium]|nr:flagellar assembly protein FliH [Chromatiales bacterium]